MRGEIHNKKTVSRMESIAKRPNVSEQGPKIRFHLRYGDNVDIWPVLHCHLYGVNVRMKFRTLGLQGTSEQ